MENNSSTQPSSATQPQSQGVEQDNNSTNPRRKTDVAWRYCIEIASNSKTKSIQCGFCNQIIKGGGINRVKQHLARVPGNVKPCRDVPDNVSYEIKGTLIEIAATKKEKNNYASLNEEIDVEEIQDVEASGSNKRKMTNHIGSYMKAGAGIDSSQPSIQAKLQSKERWHDTDMAIAVWFYDACIPINAVNSQYYKPAISRIATMGHGYVGPSYHALRIPLLAEAKRQAQLHIDYLRRDWVESGCTIMGDGWVDQSRRSLINFLVYCPTGISFIKSVDASHIVSDAQSLCNLFSEIIEMVGVNNVVHMVTDNASNYKKAGKLISIKYPNVYWSPCSAHCINLILKDVGELTEVKSLTILASKITTFVYNRKWPLAWLRRKSGWTEIVTPGNTRFGTTFIALKSLCDRRGYLEAMVISAGFKKFLKEPKAREVKDIILDGKFWNNCSIIVNVMSPIMKLLRVCDTDEKPSLGYVYEGMARAINGIKKTFKNKDHLAQIYVDIINDRWDKMLRKKLHAAAFWLNPAFQYDDESPCKKPEALKGVLDVIEKLLPNVDNVMGEIALFRDRKKGFGRALAKNNAKTTPPHEWWKVFGFDAPNLQSIAIKILSQTSSSSGCERNWSVFERIHTKKRNRLEHQRLNDLVFVHYNLRLRDRAKVKKGANDPLDYEHIDEVEFWITEEEPAGELDYDELEEIFEEEQANDENSHPSKGNEDDTEVTNDGIDLSSYEMLASSSNDGDALRALGQRNLSNDSDSD